MLPCFCLHYSILTYLCPKEKNVICLQACRYCLWLFVCFKNTGGWDAIKTAWPRWPSWTASSMFYNSHALTLPAVSVSIALLLWKAQTEASATEDPSQGSPTHSGDERGLGEKSLHVQLECPPHPRVSDSTRHWEKAFLSMKFTEVYQEHFQNRLSLVLSVERVK